MIADPAEDSPGTNATRQRMATPKLPERLPVPTDDGACNHLVGLQLPHLTLSSTDGAINLSGLKGTVVIYIYPRSSPDADDPPGWDAVPGARGCSPQGCSFRDHMAELDALGASVLGLSTQPLDHLRSEKERLHLPFPLVSDHDLRLQKALELPLLEFAIGDQQFLKRVTLVIRNGRIIKVFYPVFPPDQSAETVLRWLSSRASPERSIGTGSGSPDSTC